MLPEILKNANTPESGAQILDSMGMDKGFINDAYSKYSKYLSKVPWMNAINVKSMLNSVTGAMRGSSGEKERQIISQAKKPIFDKGKYPLVK